MAKYVIIGNSTAAIGCVEGIRSKDKDGEIVLIASENHHTYARPLISYLLQGKTDEERMNTARTAFTKKITSPQSLVRPSQSSTRKRKP